jgi:signal transduction histidine kinase
VRRPSWWPTRGALALDVAATVLVLGIQFAIGFLDPGAGPRRMLWLVIGVATALGVLLRRRFPLPLIALAVLDSLTKAELSIAMPFAAYAVARYERRRPRLRWTAVAVSVAIGLRVWEFGSFQTVPSNIANASFLILLPAIVGAWARTRTALVAALLERAVRAENEQELMARKAVLEERARITREMHDVVGHRVSLMVLQAGAIEMAAGDPDRVRQLAGHVQDAGRRSLEELRQLIGLLRTPEEDGVDVPLAPQPTLGDLDDLVADARRAGMEVSLDQRGQRRAVDPTVERTAYRLVQEALTNAGKHAPGGTVAVTLEWREDAVAVAVVNRRPTRRPTPMPSGGHGLVGLRERVRAVGGELRAEPRLDGGFVVEAVLPA